MRESSPASAAHVNRVALILLRAAAYLIVATGFNEIVSAAAPAYEPLYLYVVVAVVVTLFDGVIFGFPTGVLATAIYLVLYTRRPIDLAVAGWAAQVMFGALAVAVVIRLAWQMRRPSAEVVVEEDSDPPPMLEAAVITSSDEVVSAIELMRSEVRAAVHDVSGSRQRERDLESELRDLRAQLAEARDSERALRTAAAGEAERIVAAAQRTLDQVNARFDEADQSAKVREARLEEAYRAAQDAAAQQITQIERENIAFRESLRTQGEGEITLRTRLESLEHELATALRRAESAHAENVDVGARFDEQRLSFVALTATTEQVQAELAATRDSETALRTQLEFLAAELNAANGRVESTYGENAAVNERLVEEEQRTQALMAELERATSELAGTRNQVARLRTDEATLRAAAEAAGEAVRRTDDMVHSLQQEVSAARESAERDRAARLGLEAQFERERGDLEAEVRRLSTEVEKLAADRQAIEHERSADLALLQALKSEVEFAAAAVERERSARTAAEALLRSSEVEAEAARGLFATADDELRQLRANVRSQSDVVPSSELEDARRELAESQNLHEAARNELARVASQQNELLEELRHTRALLSDEARDRDSVVRQLTLRAETAEAAARLERGAAASASDATDQLRERFHALSRELEASRAQGEALERELRLQREEAAGAPSSSSESEQLRLARSELRSVFEDSAAEREAAEERLANSVAASQQLSVSLADERALRLAAELALGESRAAALATAGERERAQRELSELRMSHDQAIAAVDQLRRNLDSSREHMESGNQRIAEFEDAQREAETAAAEIRAERDAATEKLVILQHQVDDLRLEVTNIQADSDRKLQDIVVHLAGDHEADIGQALMEREEARAEARRITAKLTALKERFDLERNGWASERDAATEKLVILQQQVDDLRLEATNAQAVFDSKLQDIVVHLAGDHEADVGQTLMEREEARAEARRVAAQLTALQERFEVERTRWTAERDAMLERIGRAPSYPSDAETEITIPDAPATLPAPPAADIEPTLPIAASAPRPAAPLVLIAHPDLELREVARTRLEGLGYRVTTAADGLEGLRRAMTEQPDIVIADCSMPKMDGRELCQMLKSQERTAGIKVVLLATSAAELAAEPGLKPDEILRKPVRFELLRLSIASLLPDHPGSVH